VVVQVNIHDRSVAVSRETSLGLFLRSIPAAEEIGIKTKREHLSQRGCGKAGWQPVSKTLWTGLLILLIVMLSSSFLFLPKEAGKQESNQAGLKPDSNSGDSVDMHGDRPGRFNSLEFQAGINLLVYGQPDLAKAAILFEHLKKLGMNSLAIAYPLSQSGWQASEVKIDPAITPDMAKIRGLIRSAKANNFYIMLRPILDENNLTPTGHWRGTIEPENAEAWFTSYRSLILPYVELAQQEHVEIFNIGTELNSLQRNLYVDEWIRLIEEIRKIYRGGLIYSFNWDCYYEIPSTGFVPMLDYTGIDAYFPLDVSKDAGTRELEKAWEVWIERIKEAVTGKIIVTEAGIIPAANAYLQPYTWSIPGKKIDRTAQSKYYEATFNAWRPLAGGIYWWCVTLDQPDSLYSPVGTPTEEVLKKHLLH